MPEFVTNECGHIVTRDTFPMTLCQGKHMCGALFDPYGVSDDCLRATSSVKVCKKCLAAKNKMIKAKQNSPEVILEEIAEILNCPVGRDMIGIVKKMNKKLLKLEKEK